MSTDRLQTLRVLLAEAEDLTFGGCGAELSMLETRDAVDALRWAVELAEQSLASVSIPLELVQESPNRPGHYTIAITHNSGPEFVRPDTTRKVGG